jgi:hypothetical protein
VPPLASLGKDRDACVRSLAALGGRSRLLADLAREASARIPHPRDLLGAVALDKGRAALPRGPVAVIRSGLAGLATRIGKGRPQFAPKLDELRTWPEGRGGVDLGTNIDDRHVDDLGGDVLDLDDVPDWHNRLRRRPPDELVLGGGPSAPRHREGDGGVQEALEHTQWPPLPRARAFHTRVENRSPMTAMGIIVTKSGIQFSGSFAAGVFADGRTMAFTRAIVPVPR